MASQSRNRYEAYAQIIKALAHPTRLQILESLAEGERCVCELQGIAGSDMSTVSKHLAVMRNAGLLTMDKRGTMVFYALRVPCILDSMKCVEAVLRAKAEEHLELVK